jgi:hypothetical protein
VVHDAAEAGVVRRAFLVVACALALAVAGCGSGDDASRPLAWEGDPVVVRQPELPDDTTVSGRVRNETDGDLELDVADVKVVRADGTPVRSTVTFAEGYSHSLYPPRDAPRETPREEAERLGRAAMIEPGKTAHLTVAWRVKPGEAAPVRVELGSAELDLP